MHSVSIKKIKQGALMSTHQDGLLDICFGLFIWASGLNSLFSNMQWERPWALRLLILWIALLYIPVKALISKPRMGIVKQKKANKRNLLILVITTNILTILLFVFTVFLGQSSGMEIKVSIGIEILFLLFTTGIIAFFTNLWQIFYLGISFVVCWPLMIILSGRFNTDILQIILHGLLGIFLIIIGIIRLYNFLRTHPIQEQ